jgi:protein-tyrosine phosphatase
MQRSDYDKFDMLVGMDSYNIRNMERICGGDPEGKIHLLKEFSGDYGDVADPWYTGNFEATWQDVLKGCTAILEKV